MRLTRKKKITNGEKWNPATIVGIRHRSVAVAGFQQASLAEFLPGSARIRQDPIRSCRILAILARSSYFKTINRFLKIKKAFTIKLKIIFVDHYFCPYQTP
jgi:hypothetical protein